MSHVVARMWRRHPYGRPMQRGQATAEYLGLVLLVLVCACALVQFHTPVRSLAGDLARIVEHRPARPSAPARRRLARTYPRKPPDRACLCPFAAQKRPGPDD